MEGKTIERRPQKKKKKKKMGVGEDTQGEIQKIHYKHSVVVN
jgi:hypothetical protein